MGRTVVEATEPYSRAAKKAKLFQPVDVVGLTHDLAYAG